MDDKKLIDYFYLAIRSMRDRCHSTKKEIALLLSCRRNLDYTPIYDTRLYIKYGCEYCQLLEIIHRYFN